MRRSNCLVFALHRWWTDGGYLILRRSHYGWWPHVLWTRSLSEAPLSYVPAKPIPWQRLPWILRVLPLHTVIYRGTIVEGDR